MPVKSIKSFLNHLWIVKLVKLLSYYIIFVLLVLLTLELDYSSKSACKICNINRQNKKCVDETPCINSLDPRILPKLYSTDTKTLILYIGRTFLYTISLLIAITCFYNLIPITNDPQTNIFCNLIVNHYHWAILIVLLVMIILMILSTFLAIWLYDKNVMISKKLTNILFVYILLYFLSTAKLINTDIVSGLI